MCLTVWGVKEDYKNSLFMELGKTKLHMNNYWKMKPLIVWYQITGFVRAGLMHCQTHFVL